MVIELCRSMWRENLSKIRLIFWSFICAWFLWAETVFWLFTYLDVFGWYFLMCMSIWCLYADIFAYKLHSLIINLFLNQVFFFFSSFFCSCIKFGGLYIAFESGLLAENGNRCSGSRAISDCCSENWIAQKWEHAAADACSQNWANSEMWASAKQQLLLYVTHQ